VLQAADQRLTEVRRTVPDAGAMVIATDHQDAKAYAAQLRRITGENPTVVLSDDKGASDRIDEFSAGDSRWMVAVRMVSEGVDVPRLAVGVYATSTSTPLFFAQAVGRFVRARKRGETASVFLPSVPALMQLANEMEAERDHALDKPAAEETGLPADPLEEGWDDDLLEEANREEKASAALAQGRFEAIGSDASFHGVLFDGGAFGGGVAVGSEEEADFLGIPGLLEADQVSALLRERQSQHARRRPGAARAPEQPAVPDHRRLKELRATLSKNVSAWASRTGTPHGMVHNELRRVCGGPAVAQANEAQLQARVKKLQDWFIGRM
jgi:superfamily II DNA/RNA helicase